MDRAETRANAGSVRVVRVDRVFSEKSPEISEIASVQCSRDFSFSLSYLDHLDHLDQGNKNKGLAGPGAGDNLDQNTANPDQPAPPWHDDRAWIRRWVAAGPTLVEREPVLWAWLAATPPGPLPRGLPAAELRRIARNYGIDVDEALHAARLLAAGERAVNSPDALDDEAEVMLRGDIE